MFFVSYSSLITKDYSIEMTKIMTVCGNLELYDIRNDSYARFYSCLEHLAVDMTVSSIIRRVEGVGHKLFMDYFFSSLDLFDDKNCCNTVRSNCKGILLDVDCK
jgi:hypothetical protein